MLTTGSPSLGGFYIRRVALALRVSDWQSQVKARQKGVPMPPLLLSSFQLSMLQFDIAMSGWRRFPDGMTEQIERERNANQRRAGRDLEGGLITAPLFHVAAPAETCGLHPRFPSLPPLLNTYQGTHFFAAKAPIFVMPGQTIRMSRGAPKARQGSPDVYMLHV